MSTSEVHKAVKRPRHDDNEPMSAGRASVVHCNGARVKREHSPTPPPAQRKLVMSGTKRFAPFPSNCLPPNPEYKQHRRTWARKCQSEIEALELQKEKVLIRYVEFRWKDLYSDSVIGRARFQFGQIHCDQLSLILLLRSHLHIRQMLNSAMLLIITHPKPPLSPLYPFRSPVLMIIFLQHPRPHKNSPFHHGHGGI